MTDDISSVPPTQPPASPPAVAAPTGTSEDMETLARVIERAENPLDDGSPVSTYEELAVAVLASDWLAAREAAARAEERERIARAIEADYADWASLGGNERPFAVPLHSTSWFVERAYEAAARIAREGR